MSGWQVQEMWEADTAAEWERLNEPDPAEEQMRWAAEWIWKAVESMGRSADWLGDAANELYDTPMANKVLSYQDEIQNLIVGLKNLKEHYERGERE